MIRRALATAALVITAGCTGSVTNDNPMGDDDSMTIDAAPPPGPDAAVPVPGPPDAAAGAPDAGAPDSTVDSCGGVTSRCVNATTLEVCANGQLVQTDCSADGQECQSDGAGHFVCADPASTGDNVVSGTIRYEDRVPQPGGALGAITPKPARGVAVSVVADQGNVVLASGRSKDDGTYRLTYVASTGTQVHVLAATTSDVAGRPVKVVKLNNSVHGFGSPSFAAAANVQRDVLVTEASKEAEAFNVFDMMLIGADTVRLRMGVATIAPLKAFWQPGSTQGTFYNGSLNLLGGPSDDDGYDDAVILHEFGHYVEGVYGGTDSPGGGHNGSAVDPRLAWSEGWSTYFSSAARGNHFYMDSNMGGGFGDDLEAEVTGADGGGGMNQNVAEFMISQILWDVGDGPAGDDDARAGGDRHEDVMKIETEYLRNGIGQTRGVNGVDLVDWLDGWFKLRGLSTCGALRSIAQTHTFPYDFSAPSASCP